jgi:hypothetical protein
MTDGYYLNYWVVPSLIASIASLGLGIYILKRNLRDPTVRVFALLMFSCAIWAFGEVMMQSSSDLGRATSWGMIANSGVVFVPAFLLHFALIYPRVSQRVAKLKHFINLIYLPSLALLFLTWFTTDFFTVVKAPEGSYERFIYVPGLYYMFFLLFFFLYLILAAIKLFAVYFSTVSKTDILHTKYLGTGLIVIILFILSEVAVVFMLPFIPVIIWDCVLTLLIVGFFTAAVLKYDILEFHMIIEKSIAYLTLSIIMAAIFVAVSELLEYGLQELVAPGSESPFTGIVAALVVAFSFRPIERKIKGLADKIFPELKSFSMG